MTGPLPLPELTSPSEDTAPSPPGPEVNHVPVKAGALTGTAPPPSSTADPPPRGRGSSGGGALTITVLGTPAPQGSKRALHHSKTGRIVTIESGHERVQSWREAVKAAAFESRDQWDDRTPFPGPLVVEMTFTLNRPKHHWRTGRNAHLLRDAAPSHPATKPDIDKLQRSTLDALKDAGIYRDDSQVVDIHAAKTYPDRHMDALHIPGAVVRIWSVAS